MATVTAAQTGIGRGSLGTMLHFSGPTVATIRSYTFDFDDSYPTGGEDISSIFNDFKTVLHIFVEQRPGSASGGHGALFQVDYSGKKLLAYSALGTQVTSTHDESGTTGLRLTAIGYPK